MKLLGLILLLVVATGCTERFGRKLKNIKSNWTGGLARTCDVYTEDGTKVRTYSGKFDMLFDNDQVNFDKDGKRTIIVGGMVVCDEQ